MNASQPGHKGGDTVMEDKHPLDFDLDLLWTFKQLLSLLFFSALGGGSCTNILGLSSQTSCVVVCEGSQSSRSSPRREGEVEATGLS